MRVVIVLVLVGACDVGAVPPATGGSGITGSDGPDAGLVTTDNGADSFNAMIEPLVSRCTGCHGNGQSPNLTSFDLLAPQYKAKPGASNILANKGDHEGITYLTTSERATVASWIDSLP